MSNYNALNWYWIIGGGVIYSSAKVATVTSIDPTYVAWEAGGANRPTPLPDTATLDLELAHAGLPLSGLNPATKPQLLAYASAKLNALLVASRAYPLAAAGGGAAVTVNSDASTSTGADLLSLNVWGAANPTLTQPWVDNAFNVTVLTGAQLSALGLAVQAYGASAYSVLAGASTGVTGGTVTTTAQIDALAWPK